MFYDTYTSYTIEEIMEKHGIASRNTVYLWVAKGKLEKHNTPYGVRFTEVEGFRKRTRQVHYINQHFRYKFFEHGREWNTAPIGVIIKKEVGTRAAGNSPNKVFEDILRLIRNGKYDKVYVDTRSCLEWMGYNLQELRQLAIQNNCKIISLDNNEVI